MKKILVISMALLLTGCTAHMVVKRGEGNDPNAPVNESRSGVIKYLSSGLQYAADERRKDAYLQMHNYCGGKYKIVSEGPPIDATTGTVVPGAIATTYSQGMQYWYISFECVK